MSKPKKRRFGDRKDGRRLRTLPPMAVVEPYIMKHRNDACNQIADTIDVTAASKYVNEKKHEGLTGFSMMYVLVAAYVRCISQRPAINRFISGQRVFHRNKIVIALCIKKEMTLESPDTVIKVELEPDATAEDVYYAFEKAISDYRNEPGGGFDNAARFISKMPSGLMRIAIGFCRLLDYYGLLPESWTNISPFHASMFITSMGSLGIPSIFHHLYNFGNVPLFISFGKKRFTDKILDDGTVERAPRLDVNVVMDERICDGYYFASAWKYMKSIFKDPHQLDKKPETVVEDID